MPARTKAILGIQLITSYKIECAQGALPPKQLQLPMRRHCLHQQSSTGAQAPPTRIIIKCHRLQPPNRPQAKLQPNIAQCSAQKTLLARPAKGTLGALSALWQAVASPEK